MKMLFSLFLFGIILFGCTGSSTSNKTYSYSDNLGKDIYKCLTSNSSDVYTGTEAGYHYTILGGKCSIILRDETNESDFAMCANSQIDSKGTLYIHCTQFGQKVELVKEAEK